MKMITTTATSNVLSIFSPHHVLFFKFVIICLERFEFAYENGFGPYAPKEIQDLFQAESAKLQKKFPGQKWNTPERKAAGSNLT